MGLYSYGTARSLRELDRRRRTQTFASATCGGKNGHRFAIAAILNPEGRACSVRAMSPGQKYLRMSECVCGYQDISETNDFYMKVLGTAIER
jgi:hypothetical protein